MSQAASDAPTVLTAIVESLQTRFQEVSEDRFVEVTYAVPAYSTFAQLPTSPVSTPNRPVTANTQDYFAMPRTIIFTKGAIASSHAESLKTAASNPAFPSWPQTLVAPSSIDISVLERFIPPSSAEEYSDLFKLNRPSALVDRLIELQSENGGLAFVYPTLSGAKTFQDDYLGPIIEPLLRGLVSLHGLTSALAEEIAELQAISKLDNFGMLTLKVRQLLASINRGGKAQFSLELARKETVQADHKVWVQWFIEQEVPRFREVMNRYWQRGVRLPQDQYMSAASLVRKITDGLADGKGVQKGAGIEVGVYVIKRTK